jgi:hypothetical protein
MKLSNSDRSIPRTRSFANRILQPFVRDTSLDEWRISEIPYVKILVAGGAAGFIVAILALAVKLLLLVAPLDQIAVFETDSFIARILLPTAVAGGVIWLLAGVSLSSFAEILSKNTVLPTPEPSVSAYRDIAQANQRREREEASLFEKNLGRTFVVRSFEWRNVRLFADGFYQFQPRVNVLLGKNGYGKTLLFRTLVALLQRDEARSRQIFRPEALDPGSQADPSGAHGPLLSLQVVCDGQSEVIERDVTYFNDLVGKIPILAIPDSRFVNRAVQKVEFSSTSTEWLARSGADHFLSQEPYDSEVQKLLAQLCVEYGKRVIWPANGGFKRPIFGLIEDVVRELTEDPEFAFDTIRDSGRSGFEILIRSAGTRGTPLPIQYASQGTLSVLAIFGLIYSFLYSLRPGQREDDIPLTAAIVLIDEVDAHLHPTWQQKIMDLLTRRFPNVQFIVSGHSPLIVAGCDGGEVSVLRRNPETGAFNVKTLGEDFLGANAGDLYKRVFEIEDSDRLYREYSLKATTPRKQQVKDDIEKLVNNDRKTTKDEEDLKRLVSEDRLIERAVVVRSQKLDAAGAEARLAMLEMENKKLKLALRQKNSEAAGGENVVS